MDKVLARTIYGEARGEYAKYGPASLMGVAWVVRNRAFAHTWYGNTIDDVCLKPLQFSCWNAKDPNKKVITNVTMDDPIFAKCSDIADWVITADLIADITRGSTNYHTTSIMPKWAMDVDPMLTIGNHVFYKL